MYFKYLSAFRVLGIELPSGRSDISLIEDSSTKLKVILTSDIDRHLFIEDRGLAIGTLMLTGSLGSDSFEAELNKEIRHIQEQRKKQFSSGSFIVFEFSGEAKALDNLSIRRRDFGDFVIVYDNNAKEQTTNEFQPKINNILISLFLVINHNHQIDKVTDGIHFLSKEGIVHYKYSSEIGSLEAIPYIPINNESLEQISNYSQLLSKTIDFDSVYRLVIQATTECDDKLRSFLFSWNALEIFINKKFKEYKHKVLKAFPVNELPSQYQEFFKRLEQNKFSLKERFFVVSLLLSPEDAEIDLQEFKRVKKLRDKFTHGEDIDEDSLPTSSVVSLLRKYLKLHLEAVSV